MKKITLFLLLLLFSKSGFSQTAKFPDGIYMTIDELRNKKPSMQADIQISLRSEGDIRMMGGNEYLLESYKDSLKKRVIKKEVFAYVSEEAIYLNCYLLNLDMWYAKCFTTGNYLVFKHISTSAGAGVMFGAIGGAIAGAIAAGSSNLWVLSLRTGNVRELSQEYLVERLKDQPKLLEQFNAEPDKKSTTLWLKYINLLNEVTSPLPK